MAVSNRMRGVFVIGGVGVAGWLFSVFLNEQGLVGVPRGEVQPVAGMSFQAVVASLPSDLRVPLEEVEEGAVDIGEAMAAFRPRRGTNGAVAATPPPGAAVPEAPADGFEMQSATDEIQAGQAVEGSESGMVNNLGGPMLMTQIPAHLMDGREVERTAEYIAYRMPSIEDELSLAEAKAAFSRPWNSKPTGFETVSFDFAARYMMARFMQADLRGAFEEADGWMALMFELQKRYLVQNEHLSYPVARHAREPLGWAIEGALFSERSEVRAEVVAFLQGLKMDDAARREQLVKRFVNLRMKELASLSFPDGVTQIYHGTRVVLWREEGEVVERLSPWFSGNTEPYDPLATAQSAARVCQAALDKLDQGREVAISAAATALRKETAEVPPGMIPPMTLDRMNLKEHRETLRSTPNIFGKLYLANRLNMTALVNLYFDQARADEDLDGWILMLEER